MNMLTAIRFGYVVLGMIGIPPAGVLLSVTFDTMRRSRRKAERQTASLFFGLALALAILLVGNSSVALWLIMIRASVTLWPALIQILSMIIIDIGLIAMCIVSIRISQERKGK